MGEGETLNYPYSDCREKTISSNQNVLNSLEELIETKTFHSLQHRHEQTKSCESPSNSHTQKFYELIYAAEESNNSQLDDSLQ